MPGRCEAAGLENDRKDALCRNRHEHVITAAVTAIVEDENDDPAAHEAYGQNVVIRQTILFFGGLSPRLADASDDLYHGGDVP